MMKQLKSYRNLSLTCALFTASALYLAAPVASAADAPLSKAKNPETISFVELDANRDGFIDRKEASIVPALHKDFDALDTDKDGKLNVGEYARGSAPK